MVVGCPTEITTYATCVTMAADAIDKNACAREFQALKKCFAKKRASRR